MDIISRFKEVDLSDFPDFYSYATPLQRVLWVLWVAKEKMGVERLTAEQIASIIINAREISIHAKAITNALNRAGEKVHTYHEDNMTSFEIMKTGKDYLLSQSGGSVELFYFEPCKRFTSKRTISTDILSNLKGDLKIVDPYCNERTLDILKEVKDKKIDFLTRLENLEEKDRTKFLRELEDFKSEYDNAEFRSYPNTEIHDRYIISSDSLVILGHSIKDLGSKESFAIIMRKDQNQNIVEALVENFNRRWKVSTVL